MSSLCEMPASQEHIIAVMGITGAGKSTFTSKATGRKDIIISNNLRPCTKDAKGYVMEHKGRQVRLIDTPGFDDDEMSDADLLKIIGDFLGTLDVNGSTLAGTILLQPVTTNRVPGSEERRTRMIEKALGAPAMQNVILATTQWSKVVNKKEAQARVDERERNAAYWGWMKDNGARVVHHENTRSSARHIIGLILDNHVPVPLAMQIELAAHNFEMAFTSAGEYLISVLEETREILLQKLGKVRFKTTIPESDFSQLQEEMDELQGKLDNVEAEEIKMKASRFTFSKTATWMSVAIDGSSLGLAAAIALGSGAVLCSVM